MEGLGMEMKGNDKECLDLNFNIINFWVCVEGGFKVWIRNIIIDS